MLELSFFFKDTVRVCQGGCDSSLSPRWLVDITKNCLVAFAEQTVFVFSFHIKEKSEVSWEESSIKLR